MTKRGLLLWVMAATLLSTAVPTWAAPAAKPTGPKAGNITALLPVAHIVRGSGKQAVTSDAKKGDDLVWNDLIKTEKGGRARVTLADQSILSLGSQAELRIVKHDVKSQQTTLQMAYGRVRAQVASITRNGGSFELRTPTAVAGVIGTDFGLDSSSVGGDTFICLAGAVQVANSDKTVPGSVQCTAGQTTTVMPGKPPSPPKPATLQQLQQLIQDTEPAIIASISPAAAVPGTTFDTTIAGQSMGQVNNVSVSGSGVNASMKSASATGVQIHVVVEQTASPGPRTITLTKPSGVSSAAVFTVLGPPTGDVKTAYLQTLQELSQSGVTGLAGFLTGAQQIADQVSQQVTNANLNLPKPLDLSPFANALNQQYGGIENALQGQHGSLDTAAQNAANQFQAAYEAAYQALLQRDPTGTPDATFRTAITNAFQEANSSLQAAINGAQSLLNNDVQEYGTNLNQIQQSWLQNINSALAQEGQSNIRVNATDRTVDLGAVASFEVTSGNIVSSNWTLCAQSYQPNGYGMALDPTTTPCNAIQGFASTQNDFEIPTCSLLPGIYYARLTATDSNNKITPIDVRLTVLQPNYGTPSQTVRALADAYGSLQLSQFLRYFDGTSFPGYTQLSENMRQTLQSLGSMNINIRSSQDNVTCNDATTRADWQQNYTFRNSVSTVFQQEEQLSIRLRRVPGTGWLITDLQGDNGTVQGVPPGPIVTDAAVADLALDASAVTLDGNPLSSGMAISPGSHQIAATITNIGNANFTAPSWNVLFSATLNNQNVSNQSNFTDPIALQGQFVATGTITIPAADDGTAVSLNVNVDSQCGSIQEKSCANNQQTYLLTVQNHPKYVITTVTFAGHNAPFTGKDALQVGEATQVLVTVQNQGGASPTGTLTVSATCNDQQRCNAIVGQNAAPAAGNSTVIPIKANFDGFPVASFIGTASVTSDISGALYGPDFTVPFDVVDFTIAAPNAIQPAQNMPIGGAGTISVAVAVQVPQGSQFGIQITPTKTATVSYTPATQTTFGNDIPFTANIGPGQAPSGNQADLMAITATNHGVSKSTTIPVNYFNAALTPLNLFVNDPGNPLVVPVATGLNAPTNYPDISLKMAGNYIGGSAGLTVQNPNCGGFSDTPFPTSVDPGTTVDFPIYASTGNTCPAASQVVIRAAIPLMNPPTPQTVYTLYVTPKQLPLLEITGITPAREITAYPWLAGEPMDWTVTVHNAGSGNSAGNEPLTLSLNNAEIGRAPIPGSIAPNASTNVVVHTVGPDLADGVAFGPNFTLLAHIVLGSQGDLDPRQADFSFALCCATNWSLVVNGAGQSDTNPVALNTIGPRSGQANVVLWTPQGNFNPNLLLPVVVGSYSVNQMNPPSPNPKTITSSNGSTVTIGLQTGLTPLTGYYFGQVIAQMKDGGNVTTQRQATVHIYLTNDSGKTPAYIDLASDRNNIAQCLEGCNTPPSTVQVNGPLPEAITLTATVESCQNPPCTGSVDVSFNDSSATRTTPVTSTIQVTAPNNTLPIRVKAADNPDGSITPGPALVYASVTAIQASAQIRGGTVDRIGNNQYTMSYNIGDLQLNASTGCIPVRPQDPMGASLSMSWLPMMGFNVPSLSWEWEDGNHLPVGGNPLSFSVANGTSTYSNGNYTALPTFNLTNPSNGIDGIQTYYLAVTVTNNLAVATEYFPFQFDLSQSQTFCPLINGKIRGNVGGRSIGGHIIRGSWSKTASLGSSAGRASAKALSARLPDVRVNAGDVSFTPSMPKTGDAVNVRFRISNVGEADAAAVPVALQVNGSLVASDTFDVAAGKTVLGSLQWNNAKLPASSATAGVLTRAARVSRDAAPLTPALGTSQAAVVIDPQQTIKQKSTVAKSAPLAHFSLREAATTATLTATLNQQRVVLELGEGGCAGLRFNIGAGGCTTADVTVSVEDLAKGVYKLESANGIADLGLGNAQFSHTNFGPQALGQNGHTYAVQLSGGRVGLLTMNAVRSPDQLSEAAKRIFNKPSARVIRKLGDTTGAPDPEKTKEAKVYFDIVYQGQ